MKNTGKLALKALADNGYTFKVVDPEDISDVWYEGPSWVKAYNEINAMGHITIYAVDPSGKVAGFVFLIDQGVEEEVLVDYTGEGPVADIISAAT